MGDRWLTLDEVCKQVGISKRTLQKWRFKEGLPYVRKEGVVRIAQDDLDEFMEADKESHSRRQFG